jgi:hypothetical protein
MRLLASLGARERCRTLIAQDGTVWIWPGIHLTLRRGGEIVPVAGETIRFWVTRLYDRRRFIRTCSQGFHAQPGA